MIESLSEEVSAQDLDKGQGDDLLLDRSNSYAIVVAVRVGTGWARIGGSFIGNRSIGLVADLF
jgi:hypothetical protein